MRTTVVLPCKLDAAAIIAHDGLINCTIDLQSYANAGTALISYQWKRDTPINYDGIEHIKSVSNTTSTVKVPTGAFSRASARIELQTALTRQVLDYIVLTKSDL